MLCLRDVFRRVFALIVVVSATVPSIGASAAQSPAEPADSGRGQSILLLIADEPGRQHVQELVKGFRSAVEAQEASTLYIEYLDLYRFTDPSYRQRLGRLLATRYHAQSIDAVMAVGAPGLVLLTEQPDAPWSAAHVFYSAYDGETPEEAGALPGATGLFLEDPLPLYLRTIREVLPGTRGIALVYGATAAERQLGAAFEAEARQAGFEILDLGGFSLQETRRRLATDVPRGYVVFIRSFRSDAQGTTFSLQQPCELLADAAVRPVFMFGRFNLGCGVVGGPLTDYAAIGRWFGSQIRRPTAVASADAPVLSASVFAPFAFDARELQRWGIPAERLPPGSETVFAPHSLWRDYRTTVITAGLVVASIALLVIVLLVERERRHGLQRALSLSFREVRGLAGRLIAAREAERAQIARDLHDDLSQSLALLAINIDRLEAAAAGATDLRPLATRAGRLQTAVHALSRQLHPSRLRTLGLVAAVQGLCRDVSGTAGLEVRFENHDVPDALPPEIALCLYRVVEEALHNAARHSGAAIAGVTLTGEPAAIRLEVADDGRGFLPYAASSQGVGIGSMRERVRYFDGDCRIESGPGIGTRVVVRIPYPPSFAPGAVGESAPAAPALSPTSSQNCQQYQ